MIDVNKAMAGGDFMPLSLGLLPRDRREQQTDQKRGVSPYGAIPKLLGTRGVCHVVVRV